MISESLRKIVKKSNILAILFALVAIFSVSNISSQIEEGRIIPFGILNNVFAEFSRSAPNSTKLAKNLSTSSNIQDQSDRCQIVDPNRPDILTAWEYEGVSGAQIKGDNIAGANPGVSYGAGFDAPKDETVRDYASSLGMSYNLAIFSAPNEVGNAIAFVNANIDAGFIPIVRLCVAVADSCQFNSPNDVIGFYTALHDGANGEFIAMVGPNEPGTGEDGYIEMNGFGGINSYAQIINFVNEAATGLQKYRSINGGKMYLSPGAFNLTNPINRDVYEYLYNPSNPKLKINLFDYLMGNVYAQGEPAVKNVPYPYATYRDGENHDGNGLGNFAEENNIPVILTEFGIFKEAGDSKTVLLNEAIESFKLFCADETIAGVLFFQSFLNDDGTVLISDIEQRKEFHGLTKQEHSLIIGDCTKSSPFKDWAWANCNFDSCIYKDYEYDPKSTASACGVEDKPLTGDGKPALKVVCSNGICSTRAIKTIDIGMPIRHFGGNSLNGSPTHQYPSICSELSTQFANKNYDTINQFAGVINMGGTQYPMPWLGSAINCASQLLLATQEFAYLTPDKYTFNPHPGSKIEEIVNEINSDEIYGMPWETYNGAIPGEPLYDAAPTMNETRSIIDEAAICLMRDEATDLDDRLFCLDKRKNPNQVFAFNDYDPYKSDLEWEKSTCNTNMVYRKDPKNMIYGPEIQVSDIETVETISESELCYEFARRNSEGVTSKILAGVDYPRYFPDGDTSNATPNCQIDRTKFVNGVSCAALSCSSSDILKGKCKADLRFKDCFNYVNSSQSSEHQIYLKADSNVFAQVPQVEIEGIYDALYWMYLRTQNSFKNKKFKIVFRENIGMNVEVNSKIRDANRGKDDALNPKFPAGESENLYAQELNSCEVPDNMYSYNNLLAKNSPIKTQYQYFDWLGYLDILQEIQKVYFGNTHTCLISTLRQNLDSLVQRAAPNSDREFILVSGSALKTMSYPLFTCDELNLRIAKDPYFTLIWK
ncbi:MAG: hypothetical protein KatS3mg085_094 [Candidatus Dojkabacteria bacterium]|nr:MAG: hypothetical protein KatS3mg085_094 [Candidatus Dojkabacteria bacterium]